MHPTTSASDLPEYHSATVPYPDAVEHVASCDVSARRVAYHQRLVVGLHDINIIKRSQIVDTLRIKAFTNGARRLWCLSCPSAVQTVQY